MGFLIALQIVGLFQVERPHAEGVTVAALRAICSADPRDQRYENNRQTCLSYIQGVVETLDAVQPAVEQTSAVPSGPHVCRPANLRSDQLIEQVISYLSSHQIDDSRPAVSALTDVLAELYPCRATGVSPAGARTTPLEIASPPLPAPATSLQEDREFLVYFPLGGTAIKPSGLAIVKQAIEYAKAAGAKKLVITGYDDTYFSVQRAWDNSRERALSVLALLKSAIKNTEMEVLWRGSADLAVPTPQHVSEALNRRVTIVEKF